MELKKCPFCKESILMGEPIHTNDCYFYKWGHDYPANKIREAWNTRPLEDELQAKLDIAVEAMKRANTEANSGWEMYEILVEALEKLEARDD